MARVSSNASIPYRPSQNVLGLLRDCYLNNQLNCAILLQYYDQQTHARTEDENPARYPAHFYSIQLAIRKSPNSNKTKDRAHLYSIQNDVLARRVFKPRITH
jgi:hypothetical protein